MKNPAPKSLEEFTGQPRAKRILNVLLRSARRQNSVLPHLLIAGPSGVGKSTVATILAEEQGGGLHQVVASELGPPGTLVDMITSLQERDVLFIDETHGLGRTTEEVLYSAMQEGCVARRADRESERFMKSLGVLNYERSGTIELPAFTLIGATTLAGLVSAPLRSRFAHTIQLRPYELDELTRMVREASSRMNFPLSDGVARQVAKRSRGTARTAMQHLRWIAEFCIGGEIQPTLEAVQEAFAVIGVDEHGLTDQDSDYLRVLVEAEAPLGLTAISIALHDTSRTIMEVIEPHLIREGYVAQTARGRLGTAKAVEYVRGLRGVAR